MTDQDALNRIAALPAQGVTEAQIDAALDAMEANMRALDMDPPAWRKLSDENRLGLRACVRDAILAALAPAEAGGVEWDSQIAKPCAQRICGLSDTAELCGARPGEPCRGRSTPAPVDALVKAAEQLRAARNTKSVFTGQPSRGDIEAAMNALDAALAAYRGEAK